MKIILIPYQDIYNIFVKNYFDEKNNAFIYENGKYIFTEKVKANDILKAVDKIILDIISHYNSEYKFYIIDTCYPEHHYTNTNTDNIELTSKYTIDEPDIVYNEIKINQIFDKFFKINFKKSSYNNVVFIKHKKLNLSDICYMFITIYPSFVLSRYNQKYDNYQFDNIDYIERKIPDKIRDSIKQFILKD